MEKVFINIRRIIKSACLACFVLLCNCSNEPTDEFIPLQPFPPININLNLPEYQTLRSNGFYYLNGGVRGILLHRTNDGNYIAYERNCSFQPFQACATVEMHPSFIYMQDVCCGSTFDLASGQPTSGPAWRPLRRYETLLNGSQLTITDTVID